MADAAGDSSNTCSSGTSAAADAIVKIRCSSGSKFSVETSLELTIEEFKALIAEQCNLPADKQRLIYKGRVLKDEQTLASYDVESDHTIHVVRIIGPSTASSATATANLGASRASNSTATASPAVLFPGLDVNGPPRSRPAGLFGAEIPEFDQVQQQLPQNSAIMREIMNLPAIQNIMNNPEIIRNFIMNNHQMQQIIDRNPEIAHVLNDPNTLRQTLEAARNPELMREMMRNTDRAMSNIESSPEGFNMLRRMYETVQEPFLSATAAEGDAGNNMRSNPFAALLGNQGAARPRDNSHNTAAASATAGSPSPNANPLPNPWNTTSGGTQTTNSRSSLASNPLRTGITGLGDLGIPDLDGVMSTMPDSSLLTQVMQNPAMMQTMQSLLSDPQYVNQVLNSNPSARSLLESNTHLREMLQNPEFLRQISSPETMRQLLSLQQSLFSQVGQQLPREQNQTGGGTGLPSNNGLEVLMNMFGGFGTGGFSTSYSSNLPPEERFATQLAQLQEMGFFDTQENIQALTASAGNVHAAVERLLGNLGQ